MQPHIEHIQHIVAPKITGINDCGEMALVPLSSGRVIGRGLLEGGGSCIFAGNIIQKDQSTPTLLPTRVILSPVQRPLTAAGETVVGYEDPTLIEPVYNPFEPDRRGILLTEAYRLSDGGAINTNLLYFGLETGMIQTVLTPLQALALGLRSCYKTLDMVKEAEIFSLGPWQGFLIEVGADGHSRIAHMTLNGTAVTSVQPFMDPCAGSWYSDHVSPASMPIPLTDRSAIVLINGRDATTWRVGWIRLQGDRIIEIGQPFLEPDSSCDIGPGGQRIAFASSYELVDGWLLPRQRCSSSTLPLICQCMTMNYEYVFQAPRG